MNAEADSAASSLSNCSSGSESDLSLNPTSLPDPTSDQGEGPCPRATLVCRPNSHPFQERNLALNAAVKVGRSVARARPASTNAIFDCKVLSRNHALIWYENGKFYLQDTKSSNGTFVNNQRLSKGSEESLPREVCSGDILQFGVDVMENSRKVTHGCIIATLKLYLPDGKEAKASPTIVSGVGGHLPPQDLYLLNQYIQEALAREQLLETKLTVLQRIVNEAELASGNAWKAMIDEDRLLTRVEILESQLSAYSKSMSEEKLRQEVQRLVEEKEEYQKVAKYSLNKICQEKLEAQKKIKDVAEQLSSAEKEVETMKRLYRREAEENKRLLGELESLYEKLQSGTTGDNDNPDGQDSSAAVDEREGDQVAEQATTDRSQTTEALPERVSIPIEEHNEEVRKLREQIVQLQNENVMFMSQITDLGNREADAASGLERLQGLKDELDKVRGEKFELQEAIDRMRDNKAADDSSSPETREKLVHLMKVKERFDEVSRANSDLENSLAELEEKVDSLTMQKQFSPLLYVIFPIFIFLVSIVAANLSWFSAVFGTADDLR